MKYDYDLIVIGGGAAGLFAASVANALGAKVCLIDRERLGGDCTWFGCIPSKAFLKSAATASALATAAEAGLRTVGEFSLDTAGVMEHVRRTIEEVATHHPPEVFEGRGIKVIFGTIQFFDKNTVRINEQKVTAKKIIVATGSHPLIPPIEGLKSIDYLTNENVFNLNSLPQSLTVLGGGPIGVELAQSFARLGVKVAIIEMLERILPREDKDVALIVEEALRKEGINVLTNKKALKFEKKEDGVITTLQDKAGNKETITAERVLIAVGRVPGVKGLLLEVAGVEYSDKGIKVNEYLQTTNKDIYACGDVVGPYMFSHVAAYQASVCVRNALFRRIAWQKADYGNIAWATFTEPEVAHLGLTEEEARKKHRKIKVYTNRYTSSDRAITDLEKGGLVKIITNKKGLIVGSHIAGAHASEIIQGLLVTKALRQPLAKIAPILFIYPTLSELVKSTATQAFMEKAKNPLLRVLIKLMRRA